MIHPERVQVLNPGIQRTGRYVLYWMQQSQRSLWNHALEYAIAEANERGLPLVVCFGLMADYPEANERHFAFLLEGLAETAASLRDRGIHFVLRFGEPWRVALEMEPDAAMIVCDCGYLRHQRAWRRELARRASCPVIQVESDVVVPALTASAKEEWAAATLRPKLRNLVPHFLAPLPPQTPKRSSLGMDLPGADVSAPDSLLQRLEADTSVGRVRTFPGGASQAHSLFRTFLEKGLPDYDTRRSDPLGDACSRQGAFLHFGQVSPVWMALEATNADVRPEAREAFLEQLIVRRELSINFVLHNAHYDDFGCLPEWARQTLSHHAADRREYNYSMEDLDNARTHDRYWNAAMTEMRSSGYMHNALRMYWCKKILEWSAEPREAFRRALWLNNRYFLDGRDPNSYAGVAWCFGKHDRPWPERPIFGTVRYMNAGGLQRKFDAETYARKHLGRDEDVSGGLFSEDRASVNGAE